MDWTEEGDSKKEKVAKKTKEPKEGPNQRDTKSNKTERQKQLRGEPLRGRDPHSAGAATTVPATHVTASSSSRASDLQAGRGTAQSFGSTW